MPSSSNPPTPRWLVLLLAIGLPLLVISAVAITLAVTRSTDRNIDPMESIADSRKEMLQRDNDNKKRKASYRDAFQKLIRSKLKYECEFLPDDDFIGSGAGWGTVIVSNGYGANRRVKWRIFLTDEFEKLNADRQEGELSGLHIGESKYIKDFSIGGWDIYRDGKIVDDGKI